VRKCREPRSATVRGAELCGLPVILQISENAVRYHGRLAPIGLAMLSCAEASSVPVAVHLDHATEFGLVAEAVELGFHSRLARLARIRGHRGGSAVTAAARLVM
jgi:fructose-bisphosphate aldolase class II